MSHSKSSIGLIITAAGKGTRFSNSQNKLLIHYSGVPLIVCTVTNLLNAFKPSQVVLTVHADDEVRIGSLMSKHGLAEQIRIVTGGDTRRESVELGFNALSSCDWVMIHDGARPNVSGELISRLIAATVSSEAVIPGIEIVDTVKRVSSLGDVIETIPRSELMRVQTPQLFAYRHLLHAYREKLALQATDEAMIMEALGVPIKVVQGDPENQKITTQHDVIVGPESRDDIC